MKKLVAFMLCCMMMVGALSAFAEDGIMPRIECFHRGDWITVETGEETDGCTTITYYEVYCEDCGDTLKEYSRSSTVHEWYDDIIDGEEVTVCGNCGAVK